MPAETPMDDVDQMLINELRRVERALGSRQRALAAVLEKETARAQPRRYVIEVPIPIPVAGQTLGPFEDLVSAFVVDRESKMFCCEEITATCSLVGTLALSTPAVANVSIPIQSGLSNAGILVAFTWEVRDTMNDRAWSNLPIPHLAVGGRISGLPLARPAVLVPGTEVVVNVHPKRVALDPAVTGSLFSTLTSFKVQFSFTGFEVTA